MVYFYAGVKRRDNVVVYKFEVRICQQIFDIARVSGIIVINGYYFISLL